MKNHFFTIVISLFVGIIGCTEVEEPLIDNIYDEKYEYAKDPLASITDSPEKASEITQTSATFKWSGTGGSTSEFSYMLEGVDEHFNDWSNKTSVIYHFLDEGNYNFLVKERFQNKQEQSNPTSVNFYVNSIQEFGLILEKMNTEASNGSSFSINLNIEEADNLNGLTTVINYDSGRLNFHSAQANNVDGIDNIGVLTNEISSGVIEINILLLGTSGGYSGNASLCQLNFTSNSNNESTIDIDESKTVLRDYTNRDININTFRSATVNQ